MAGLGLKPGGPGTGIPVGPTLPGHPALEGTAEILPEG